MNNVADILLVEDNKADQFLFEECARLSSLKANLYFVADGEQALDFLRKIEAYADRPTPNAVLLDLNLPRMDGRDVLREIKNDDKLRGIPIFVMSTSSSPHDISEAYDLGAVHYVVKPNDFTRYKEVVEDLIGFCLGKPLSQIKRY